MVKDFSKNKQTKKVDLLESKNNKNKGTTFSGNALRVTSTILAFMLFGPIGGVIVGTLVFIDYKSKGKFSEAGKDFLSGLENVLESLRKVAKSLTEKFLPQEKEQEVDISKNEKPTNFKGLSVEAKTQAKGLATELMKVTSSQNINDQSRINLSSKQQGRTYEL